MNLRIQSSEFARVKGPFRWSYDKDDGTLVSVVDPCFGKFQNLLCLQEIFSKRLLSGVLLRDRLCRCWAQSAFMSVSALQQRRSQARKRHSGHFSMLELRNDHHGSSVPCPA